MSQLTEQDGKRAGEVRNIRKPANSFTENLGQPFIQHEDKVSD